MPNIDWHKDPITKDTKIDSAYKTTQNVRRFFKRHCGEHFKFDRSFMAWMNNSQGVPMRDAITEWQRRQS